MNDRSRITLLISAVAAMWLSAHVAAQVPEQDRQSARAALRPPIMGPSGGVSAGHPLTTAVALGVLLRGGNAFDAGAASLLTGGVIEQEIGRAHV